MDTILKNSIILSSHNTLVDKQINGNLIFGVIDFLIALCVFCKIPICIEIDIKSKKKIKNKLDYIIGHCDKIKFNRTSLKNKNINKKTKLLNKYLKLSSNIKKSFRSKKSSVNVNKILNQCISGNTTLSFILKYITNKYKKLSQKINKTEFIPPIILSFDISTYFLKENKNIVYEKNFIDILKNNIDKKFLVLGNCENEPLSKFKKKILLRFKSKNNVKNELPNIRNIVKINENDTISSKSYVKDTSVNNLLNSLSKKSMNRIYPKIKKFTFNIDKLNKISDKNSHNMILKVLLNKKYTKKNTIINMIAINFNNINYKNKYLSSSYLLIKILKIFFTYYKTTGKNINNLMDFLTDINNNNTTINPLFIYDFIKTISPNYKINSKYKTKCKKIKLKLKKYNLDKELHEYYDDIDYTIINNLIKNK